MKCQMLTRMFYRSVLAHLLNARLIFDCGSSQIFHILQALTERLTPDPLTGELGNDEIME